MSGARLLTVGQDPRRCSNMKLHWLAFLGFVLGMSVGSCSNSENSAACPVVCGMNQTCDTGSTPPGCKCQDAYTGRDCTACASGYVRGTDSTCQAIPVSCTNPTV